MQGGDIPSLQLYYLYNTIIYRLNGIVKNLFGNVKENFHYQSFHYL